MLRVFAKEDASFLSLLHRIVNIMRNIHRAKFIFELFLLLILWPSIYANDSRPTHDLPVAESTYDEIANHRDDGLKDVSASFPKPEIRPLPPIPFHHQTQLPQEAASFVTKHEYQRASSNRQPGSIQYQQQPTINVRRQQSEIHYHKKKYTPDMSYLMNAGGKEKIYVEDSNNEYRPSHEFSSPGERDPHSTEYSANKKMNYEKSYKKYKYAYSSKGEGTAFHAPDHEIDADEVKARAFAAPGNQHYPKYVHPEQPPTMDFYAAKSTSWKQLGPNVEISTSAEHPVYSKRDSPSETSKSGNKKRKILPKNVRTSYLNNQQQHALYISNNLGNFANLQVRPIKGIFDHNNVLKQSDKFELSDAMFQELEEAAKKNNEVQMRIKQETPKEPFYKYQTEMNTNGFPHYYQPKAALLNALPIEPHPYIGKYYQPHSVNSFSKGFIRNIEIETSPSGGKKMIPALIIPLTPDQLNNQLFNHEIGLYVNNPEVLNPGVKMRHGQPFPYEMTNSRYSPNDPYNAVLPVENYQYQISSPYDFHVPVTEENYNPYLNYQSHNLYKLPYNLNSVSSTPTLVEAKTPETRAAPVPYSAKKKASHKAPQQQHQQPIQASRLSQVHPSENSKVNYKREEYVFDANKNEHYLSGSESFTTVSSVMDKDQKMVEKIETKAN